jgi:predicted GIY-YIG superfamily endonuclease
MTFTYLYRLLDGESRLLYIGISNAPIYRLFQHLEEKPWAPQITWQHVKRYESREEAEQAERECIRTERPLYNIRHNDKEHVEAVATLRNTSPEDRRRELFATFERNGVPKDPDLTTTNARALARAMCGQAHIYNFTRADWIKWCFYSSATEIMEERRGTHG